MGAVCQTSLPESKDTFSSKVIFLSSPSMISSRVDASGIFWIVICLFPFLLEYEPKQPDCTTVDSRQDRQPFPYYAPDYALSIKPTQSGRSIIAPGLLPKR
jgi:hypothetical protein